MSFASQVSCSVQTVTGASSTFQFFFSEAFLGQHFEAVELEQGDPEPGDLFLFRLRSPTGRWCGAHVGVYCGHGEIIHFEGKKPGSCGPQKFLGSWEGVVCKQGRGPMLRSRSLWRVLRRRGGINRTLLELRVREAMDTDPPPYHPTRNNCVHFALHLLGLDRNPNSVRIPPQLRDLLTALPTAPAKFRPSPLYSTETSFLQTQDQLYSGRSKTPRTK